MSRRQEIATNLQNVQEKIVQAALEANRSPEEITVIAVTKTYPHEDIEILKSLGVNNFGENRDSEGAFKSKEVAGVWHFQGQIQSNKLKSITSWAHVIHSLDDVRHFEIIDRVAPHPLGIFCQVSLDGVENRGGVAIENLYQLASAVEASTNHKLLGLMSVAPLTSTADEAFAQLAQIQRAFVAEFPNATQLSAGMSGDFESAIRHGATHIRVGSSILGSRSSAM